MSAELFSLVEQSKGVFLLTGELTFASANRALKRSAEAFSQRSELVFDLSAVRRVDSAGLALLLDWLRRARELDVALRYVNLPEQMLAIARLVHVDNILARAAKTERFGMSEAERQS
jgi:phospholipid transport system transporter-binding protein